MHVGYGVMFQGLSGAPHDREVYRQELALAEQAEGFGFESIWTTEHHFSDYALTPNPLQLLSYFAGRTETALLGSMVVVLPWHNPMRVAEEIAVLDHLSNGRFVFGIGRGVARREFDRLGIDMAESRSRFVEAAELILSAFDKGYAEADGAHIKQLKADLRPAPLKSLRGRTYAAAVSPESSHLVAKLGAGLLIIPQKPWKDCFRDVEAYRDTFRKMNGAEAPQPIASGWVVCDVNEERAYERARKYIGAYYKSVLWHYEMKGEHFAGKTGYEYYSGMAEKMRDRGDDAITDFFLSMHPWGTPEQCYAKIVDIHSKVNNSHFIGNFSFGGAPFAEVAGSVKLFSQSVLPELRKFKTVH